jgi:hypothetical protein
VFHLEENLSSKLIHEKAFVEDDKEQCGEIAEVLAMGGSGSLRMTCPSGASVPA